MNYNKKYGKLTDKQREEITNFIKTNKKSIDRLNQTLKSREKIYGYTNEDFLSIIYEGIVNAYRSDNPRSHKNVTSVFRHCHWAFKKRCTKEKLRNYGLKLGQEALMTAIRWEDYIDSGMSRKQIAKAAKVSEQYIQKGVDLRDNCTTYRTVSLDNLLEKSVPFVEPTSNTIEKLEREIDRQKLLKILSKPLGYNRKQSKVVLDSLLKGYRMAEISEAAKKMGISTQYFYILRRNLVKRMKRTLDKRYPTWREDYNDI